MQISSNLSAPCSYLLYQYRILLYKSSFISQGQWPILQASDSECGRDVASAHISPTPRKHYCIEETVLLLEAEPDKLFPYKITDKCCCFVDYELADCYYFRFIPYLSYSLIHLSKSYLACSLWICYSRFHSLEKWCQHEWDGGQEKRRGGSQMGIAFLQCHSEWQTEV